MFVVSPIGTLFKGLLAGMAGSAAQNLFFKATGKLAPKPPKGVFQPPESEQASEGSLQTVARRYTDKFMMRGPLSEEQKKRGGMIVHYGFGAGWGGLYALVRESYPALRRPLGTLGFSSVVWMVSDNFILPLFKLAAWPQKYPLKAHVYALVAHFAYGLAVAETYSAIRRGTWDDLASGALRLGTRLPLRRQARLPFPRRFVKSAALHATRPWKRTAAALRA